jgi:hypothetical protein
MVGTWVVAELGWRRQALVVAVDPRLWDPRLLWGTLLLAAAIIVGGVVIAVLDRWRKREVAEQPSASGQLAHFRELYEQGDLTEKEFARIKARLAEQLREELDMPAPPSAEEEPPPSSSNAPQDPPS